MKRIVRACLFAALLIATSYGSYVWGWYQGLNYDAVVSGMSEAKWSLSAARSIRQSDPQLALELLDANISWADVNLRDSAADVPAAHEGNYAIVLKALQEYRDQYAAAGSQ